MTPPPIEDRFSGAEIGGYRLVSRLGHGPKTVVYLAEKLGEMHRKAAMKILPVGNVSPEEARLLRLEGAILRRLDTPHVPRWIAEGETPGGDLYLVMQYVEQPQILTAWCDGNHCSLEERLELFLTVCRAVHALHRKGVFHGDLKPANILLSGAIPPLPSESGAARRQKQGTLYIVDFECAAAPETGSVRTPPRMTPMYASLQRMQGSPPDASSDTYSLGVILYQLLAGRLPYWRPGQDFESSAIQAAQGTVQTPSSAVTTPSPTSNPEQWARVCNTKPRTLSRKLRGDLDQIVLKAISPATEARYAGADLLAADIERWRSHLPNPNLSLPRSVRVRKFVRRHRQLIAAAVAVAALALGLMAADFAGFYAEGGAHQAESARRSLRHAMSWAAAAGRQGAGGEVTEAHLLETTASVTGNFPGIVPSIAEDLGSAWKQRGDRQRLRGDCASAVGSYRSAIGSLSRSSSYNYGEPAAAAALTATHKDLSFCLGELGRKEEALEEFARSEPETAAAVPAPVLRAWREADARKRTSPPTSRLLRDLLASPAPGPGGRALSARIEEELAGDAGPEKAGPLLSNACSVWMEWAQGPSNSRVPWLGCVARLALLEDDSGHLIDAGKTLRSAFEAVQASGGAASPREIPVLSAMSEHWGGLSLELARFREAHSAFDLLSQYRKQEIRLHPEDLFLWAAVSSAKRRRVELEATFGRLARQAPRMLLEELRNTFGAYFDYMAPEDPPSLFTILEREGRSPRSAWMTELIAMHAELGNLLAPGYPSEERHLTRLHTLYREMAFRYDLLDDKAHAAELVRRASRVAKQISLLSGSGPGNARETRPILPGAWVAREARGRVFLLHRSAADISIEYSQASARGSESGGAIRPIDTTIGPADLHERDSRLLFERIAELPAGSSSYRVRILAPSAAQREVLFSLAQLLLANLPAETISTN
jgi:serine/threonine protein kinase